MRTVFKYKLDPHWRNKVSMPAEAQILHVAEQGWDLHIWALVDPAKTTEDRSFLIFGTGHPVEEGDLDFIGTVLHSNGLVWHVFEDKVRGKGQADGK